MTTLNEQIKAQKEAKQERLKDLFYVDYCYHCKDPEIKGVEQVSCHHPWYCHHESDVMEVEAQIGAIKHAQRLRGYSCAYEIEKLKKLGDEKWELIKQGRRNLPRIKQ